MGNSSGRPTAAQTEWIAKYGEQAAALISRFETVKRGSLAQLNAS